MNPNRYDDLFVQMTQDIGAGVQGILDAFLGFLFRRTDFYYQAEPNAKIGFPPGAAEGMIYQYFKKYQAQHFKRYPQDTSLEEKWKKFEEERKKEMEKAKEEAKSKVEAKKEEGKKEESKSEAPIALPVKEEVKEKPKEKEVPKEPEKKPVISEKMKSISTYNGDVTDKYKWGQDCTSITAQFDIPPNTKAKMLDIKFTNTTLTAKFKNQPKPFIQNEFCERIKIEDSYWTIEENNQLIFHLQKQSETIWGCLFKGDKAIDTKSVDTAKPAHEFDLETQAAFPKIMYEMNRMNNGLPSTQQEESMKLKEMLKKSPNSPLYEGEPQYAPQMPGQKDPPKDPHLPKYMQQ